MSFEYGLTIASPFRFIILASQDFNDVKFDEFALYHEIGHLYYHHVFKRTINSRSNFLAAPLALVGSLIGLISIPVAFGALMIAAVNIVITTAYERSQEREADLFACDQLIKQGRADLVYKEVEYPRGSPEHHEKTYQVWPYLSETHPSFPEKRLYLKECLKKHGFSMTDTQAVKA